MGALFDAALNRKPSETLSQGAPPVSLYEQAMGRTRPTAEEMGLDMQGLSEPTTRFGLAWRDTFEEKRKYFRQKYPEADLRVTDRGLEYRKTMSEAWNPVDPSGMQARAKGEGHSEFLSDIADFAGDMPELIGDIAGVILTRGRGVRGRVAGPAIPAAGGEALQQAAQTATGTQMETPEQQAQRIVGTGAATVIGGAAGEALATGVSRLRTGGALGVPEEARTAQAAAERLRGQGAEIPGFTLAQQTSIPFIAKAEQQTASVFPRLGDIYRKQDIGLVDALRTKQLPKDRANLISRMRESAAKTTKAVKNRLYRTFRMGGDVDKYDAALARQRGLDEWQARSYADVDVLYRAARGEEVTFSPEQIMELKAVAADVQRQTQVWKAPKKIPFEPGLETVGRIAPERRIPPTVPPESMPVGTPPVTDVKNVVTQILEMDPNIRPVPNTVYGGADSPLDQLLAIQRSLYDATLRGPEGQLLSTVDARRLRGKIGEIIRNPTNLGPEFRETYDAASSAAAKRFKDLEELSLMGQIGNVADGMPDQALRNMIDSSDKARKVQQLLSVSAPERWRVVQQGFVTDLYEKGLASSLAKYDDMTLKIMLGKSGLKAARQAEGAMQRLQQNAINVSSQAEIAARPFVQSMYTASSKDIGGFFTEVMNAGGIEGPLGRSIRGGLMENIFHKAVEVRPKGVRSIRPQVLAREMDTLREKGLLKFLTDDDRRLLTDVELVSAFLGRATADAGSSLYGATFTRGLIEMKKSVIEDIAHNIGIGRALANPSIQKFLLGTGKELHQNTVDALRLTGLAATELMIDEEQDRAVGEALQNLTVAAGEGAAILAHRMAETASNRPLGVTEE